MSLDKITLPGKCVLVKRDEPLKQTASGIFLGEDSNEIIDTGIIVKIGLELAIQEFKNNSTLVETYGFEDFPGLVGVKIRFKEAFAESLQIEGKEYLFFRDLEPSIYYFIEHEENKE